MSPDLSLDLSLVLRLVTSLTSSRSSGIISARRAGRAGGVPLLWNAAAVLAAWAGPAASVGWGSGTRRVIVLPWLYGGQRDRPGCAFILKLSPALA